MSNIYMYTFKEKLRDFFTEHPNEVGETYWEHFIFAFVSGAKLLIAGIISIIHAILPGIFKHTARKIMFGIVEKFNERTNQENE